MVMRNRHDGTNTPEWWDDLPPAVRKRITPPSQEPRRDRGRAGPDPGREPVAPRPHIIRDLSRLAILFLVVAIANLLFLLIALSFLVGTDPIIH